MNTKMNVEEFSLHTANHSPGPWSGPWRFSEHHNDLEWYIDLGQHKHSEANAQLVSAAPDLLAALEAAIKIAEFERHPFRPWYEAAKQAIAKAKKSQMSTINEENMQ